MRKFSTLYGMNTTPRANGPGSGGSTVSLGGGSLSMGTTVLWANAAVANTVQAASAASVSMKRFIAFSPFGDSLRGNRQVRVTRTSGASPSPNLHVRNVLNDARTSSVKYFGCSHAAKWQPLGGRP
jgi:hypothetical protein